MHVNLNTRVKVQLTAHGIKLANEYSAKMQKLLPSSFGAYNWCRSTQGADGFHDDSLWMIMRIFGDATETAFINNEIIIDGKLTPSSPQ